jgi:Nitrile hydratase, alpha chain
VCVFDKQADLWPEQQNASSGRDVVEVDIYEHGLESGSSSLLDVDVPEPIVLFDHSEKGPWSWYYSTDAAHEERPAIEERTVRNEGPPRPGQELFQALSNLLMQKGIVPATDNRVICEKLDTAGKRLQHGWMDGWFILESISRTWLVLLLLLTQMLPRSWPSSLLLSIAPSWYKSRLYRARAVPFPRDVLASFGTHLAAPTTIRVHESTADHRYVWYCRTDPVKLTIGRPMS